MINNHDYVVIEKVEEIIDKYGIGKKRIIGKTPTNKELTFTIDSWAKVNKGDKLNYTQKNYDGVIKYILDDDCIEHPNFKKNKLYKFEFLGEVNKEEKNIQKSTYYLFKGIDECIYEIRKVTPLFSKKDIGKQFNLELIGIRNGRAILHIGKIIYSIKDLEHIQNLKEYFGELENLERTENASLIIEQYNSYDNRWVISFLSYLEIRLWEYFTRKDWASFHKYFYVITNMQEWILHSKYLLLYSKEKQEDIQRKLKSTKCNLFNLEEIVSVNENFKQVDYILNIGDGALDNNQSQKLRYLIQSNENIIDEIEFIKFIYTRVFKNQISTDLIQLVLNKVEYKINQILKSIVDLNINSSKNINQLFTFCIFIYNISLYLNIDYKPYTYLSRICNVSILIKLITIDELFIIKKKIHQFLSLSSFQYKIDDVNPQKILDFLTNLNEGDYVNAGLNIGSKLDCLVLIKNNFGLILKSPEGHLGILPKKIISKSKFENLKINSKTTVYINYFNPDINIFIAGLNILDEPLNQIFDISISREVKHKFNKGDLVECYVKKIESYGIFLELTHSQDGLLHGSRIHSYFRNNLKKYFFEGQKINLVVVKCENEKIDLDHSIIFSKFLNLYNVLQKVNIKIREIKNDYVYILIDDKFDHFTTTSQFELEYLTEVEEFTCLFKIVNNRIILSNIENIKYNNNDINTIFQKNIQQFILEKVFFLEELLNQKEDIKTKIEYLNWCKLIYSQITHHRSYFINYFLLYSNIIHKFINQDKSFSEDINQFINKIENDSKINFSFSLVDKLKNVLNILNTYNQISQDKFIYLSEMLFKEEYKNISRLLILNNLTNLETATKKYKMNLDKILLSSLSLNEVNFSYDNISGEQEDDPVLDELLAIIKKGENKFVEFKSTLKTPLVKDGSVISNFNADILIQEVMKNIVGFVNSKGGKLFIGVSDSGDITGLEHDFSKFYDKVDKNDKNKLIDKFLQTLDHHIEDWIGNEIRRYIEITIHAYNGKDFCVINLNQRDSKKLYVVNHSIDKNKNQTIKNQQECYIRVESGAKKLSPADIINMYN